MTTRSIIATAVDAIGSRTTWRSTVCGLRRTESSDGAVARAVQIAAPGAAIVAQPMRRRGDVDVERELGELTAEDQRIRQTCRTRRTCGTSRIAVDDVRDTSAICGAAQHAVDVQFD